MTIVQKGIMISKLDAARRQLATAITLWFEDRDPVSIHTLVFAAYEIIHAVSKQRNPAGAVAELVGNEGGVVSGVINLESSGVEASDWRPRHDEHYHEA